jgi:hypothetical protein
VGDCRGPHIAVVAVCRRSDLEKPKVKDQRIGTGAGNAVKVPVRVRKDPESVSSVW